MTASAIQIAIGAGGGGSFVTTNTSQTIPAGKVWTGGHTFTTAVNFNGSVQLGNGSSDVLIANGRWFTNLVPSSSGLNLGASSQRWDLFGQQLSLQFGATVNNISSSSTQGSSSAIMTASAIQSAISNAGGGGGSFVTTNTSQFISGTKTFTSSGSRFSSNLRIDGNLDHNGSRLGFRGRTPSTATSIPFASSAGSTSQQLTSLRNQGNTIRALLINQGLATT